MVKYCPTCGEKLEFDAAEMCPKCGCRVGNPPMHKNPFVAFILSLFFSGIGAGQLYNGQSGKAISLFIFYAVISFIYIVWPILIPDVIRFNLMAFYFVVAGIVWLFAISDAVSTSGKINKGEKIEDKWFNN